MDWIKTTGASIAAHCAAAVGLLLITYVSPAALMVGVVLFVREWSQEQGKTGNYSITNAWRFWRWSLDKNLEWGVPAVLVLLLEAWL